MWKDFFYFSKGQRVGIIVLIFLILLVLAANFTLPLFFPDTESNKNTFLTEVEAFKKTLVLHDNIRNVERQQQYLERQRLYQLQYKKFQTFPTFKKDVPYSLFAFDPNTADSATLVQLGLKSYTASNILKYRKKGGIFRTIADFGKVYGISPKKFKELEPYISIQEKKLVKADSLQVKRKEIVQNLIVELNSADTTLLMKVKGIGRGYAKGIVRFRREMGGFVSVEQLHEIYGMRAENFDKIRPFCSVNLELVQKIKVNIASAERLDAHPYINFYQAKAIYELRRNRGKLNKINDLKELSEFTPESLAKIKPYLSFE